MFTPRERTVLSELIKGQTNKEIGKKLGISHFTVRQHLQAIGGKLGHSNRLPIALRFIKHVECQVLHLGDDKPPHCAAPLTPPEKASSLTRKLRELSKEEVQHVSGGSGFFEGNPDSWQRVAWGTFLGRYLGDFHA